MPLARVVDSFLDESPDLGLSALLGDPHRLENVGGQAGSYRGQGQEQVFGADPVVDQQQTLARCQFQGLLAFLAERDVSRIRLEAGASAAVTAQP